MELEDETKMIVPKTNPLGIRQGGQYATPNTDYSVINGIKASKHLQQRTLPNS
jgi:hypothetical protein